MNELVQWVIYDSPEDYPGKWVVRRWLIAEGGAVSGCWSSEIIPGPAYICESLEEARAHVPEGFFNMGRQPGDETQIKEVWI